MKGTKPIYRLGHAAFTITHADLDFEPVLSRLLPLCENQNIAPEQVFDVQMGLTLNINELLRQMIIQHQDCLMVEAACVVSSKGQKILISGVPNSGKTTIALALALTYGWKVVAENMTIISPEKNQIISFAAPFNLKPGTRDLLCAAKIALPGFILREWYPMSAEVSANDCDTKLALSVYLDGEVQDAALDCRKNSISEHTRKILPISNLLSTRSTEKFMQYLPEDFCYQVVGGSLTERLQKLLELCKDSSS